MEVVYMKLQNLRYAILAIILLLIPLNLNAAGKDNETSDLDSQFAKYKNGIQFYIVNGISVAYKKIMSEKNALRFHLDLSGRLSDINIDDHEVYETEYDTTSSEYDRDEKSNYQSIKLSLELLHSLNQSFFTQLYFGGGPFINYSRLVSENSWENSEGDDYHSKGVNKTFSVGLIGIIGVEYPIANRFALFAEYHLLLSHVWDNHNYDYERYYTDNDFSINHSEESGKGWEINIRNIKIGVSVYF